MIFAWTIERVAKLRQCVEEGMSSAQIAMELGGITRNAIVGKVARLGLHLMGRSGYQQQPRTKPQPSLMARRLRPFISEPARPDAPPKAIPAAPNSQPVDLMGLTNATCRWPLWNEPHEQRLYCGALEADNANGQCYCPFHARAAINRRSGA